MGMLISEALTDTVSTGPSVNRRYESALDVKDEYVGLSVLETGAQLCSKYGGFCLFV